MIRAHLSSLFIAAAGSCAGLPALAQSVPNADYTDMWWNAGQSGWGVSFMQHGANNQAYATWYTYDPRSRDAATGQFKPLWIVMTGGTWTSPTTITGRAYVLNGTPFNQSGSRPVTTDVGTVTLSFSDFSNGTFTYNLAPPGNLASNDPAFGLPPMSGSVPISRFAF
jgi:hypothetical protein